MQLAQPRELGNDLLAEPIQGGPHADQDVGMWQPVERLVAEKRGIGKAIVERGESLGRAGEFLADAHGELLLALQLRHQSQLVFKAQ